MSTDHKEKSWEQLTLEQQTNVIEIERALQRRLAWAIVQVSVLGLFIVHFSMATAITRNKGPAKAEKDRVKLVLESRGYVKTDKIPFIMKTVKVD